MGMKKKRHGGTVLALLLLLIPAVYILLQVVQVLRRPYTTQAAIEYKMADTITCKGILGTNEVDVPYEGAGFLSYIAQNGERVSYGTPVAALYADKTAARSSQLIQRLEEELETLEKSQVDTSLALDMESLSRQTLNGIYEVLDAAEQGDYTEVSAARAKIQLAENKIQIGTGAATDFSARIAELTARREALLAQISYTPVPATATGYFVSAQDSRKKLYTVEQLQAMTPEELRQAAGEAPPENDPNVAGKIITDYHWRYFAVVDAADAEKFKEGDSSLSISFPNVSAQSVPATVVGVTLDEAAGLAKVELLCDYINENVVTMEHEEATIAFKVYEGLRIDREALHTVEGETCVFVKFGNVAYQRPVSVLFEDENYILVSSTYEKDKNEIKRFDEIIVQGTDLYDEKILM